CGRQSTRKRPGESGCGNTNESSMKHAARSGVGSALTCQASVQIESLAINLGGNSMKFLSLFVLSLSVFGFTVRAAGEDTSSAAEKGSFVTLKQGDGREFRAFVAGPTDAKAAVLIVH